jgi:hypothetical protein
MKLKKSLYSRRHDREEEYGSIFNRTSTSMLFILNIAIMFLTPTLMTTSLFSKDFVLMLANILLSAGYTTFFGARLFKREVSVLEVALTAIALTLAFALTFYLAPPIIVSGFIAGVVFANHVATAINGFFLARNLVLPPCKKFFQYILKKCGRSLDADLFSVEPLSCEKDNDKDEFAVGCLLEKHCQYDIDSSPELSTQEKKEKIAPFNRLIVQLTSYVNKYTEAVFGSLTRADEIGSIKKYIDEITIKGSAANALILANMKLTRKKIKKQKLNKIRKEVGSLETKAKSENKMPDIKVLRKYFDDIKTQQAKSLTFFQMAYDAIDAEIGNQQLKIDTWKGCFPK